MANDNSKVSWDLILKVAQVLIYPILLGMIYLLIATATLDRRLAVIEVMTSRPDVDVALIQKIAVTEDRLNSVIRTLEKNGERIEQVSEALANHDDRFTEKRWNRVK